MDPRLVEAARSGNIDMLYALLREDPYILDNIEAVPFIDTPLHEAVISRKMWFVMEMMNLKPSFASKLNPNGLSPLHLAVGTSVTSPSWPWLVRRLLKVNPSLALVKGREGMTPLHLAGRNGASDIVVQLLMACPKCCQDVNVDGQTALHIAVANEKIQVLEALIGWLGRSKVKAAASTETEVLNKQDNQGNTVLHVAAYGNKDQILKKLLSVVKIDQNIINLNGLTVLDVLQSRGQQMEADTEWLVRKSRAMEANSLPKVTTLLEKLRLPINRREKICVSVLRYRSQLTDETRNALLLLSTLAITITYQIALQPPGGLNNGKTVLKKSIFQAIWWLSCAGFMAGFCLVLYMVQDGAAKLLYCFPVLPFLFATLSISGAVISPSTYPFIEKHPFSYCTGYFFFAIFISWSGSKLFKR